MHASITVRRQAALFSVLRALAAGVRSALSAPHGPQEAPEGHAFSPWGLYFR
jgi:hypothetical protein